ncbi:hypothetical protein SUNI508_08467 [Seiridium unicorne]|uniref:Transcription factor Iwr1 domain-containing protein n=1 Tax=Seiridium unicorne TaxID=138068 RepID=A0ABR2UTP6_9PEZI
MSLPPELIRVKRKASEIEPVSYLRVEEHKRHVTDAFVYQRQKREATFADIPTPSQQRPVIHTSGSRHDGTTFQSPGNNKATLGGKDENGGPSKATNTTVGSSVPASADEPRRFHMSRADMMLAPSNYPTHRSYRGISKKRSAPALFVERKSKRIPSTKLQSIAHGLNAHVPADGLGVPPVSVPSPQPEDMKIDVAEVKQRKKPGLARQAQKEGAPKKTELPASMVNRWNVDFDQLTADMNTFAMEQIGLNLQRQEEEERRRKARETVATQRSQMLSSPTQSRFKPKAPAKRYAERHPEGKGLVLDKEKVGPDAGLSETDEEDYVIETYVRVPASAMNKQHVAAKDVGLLVFDEEPDLEYFYGANEDSDDEWPEDDEDENAENYYTADYPDDEVASDDEFGHNAYAYRNGNASDLEEYDMDGYQDSGPDDGSDAKSGLKSFKGQDGTIRRHL